MTTRVAALAGLRYFADVRDIARQVDVAVPSDAAIAARFAVTDGIDLDALAADGVMLTGVVHSVTAAVDSAHDARGTLPDSWRGRAADAADTAVATHVQTSYHTVERIRVVADTVVAATAALARIDTEKHRTLGSLKTDQLAGQSISTITNDDVEVGGDSMRQEISAAVELFTRTMDTVDAAVSTVLATLTRAFADLPDPVHPGPAPQHRRPRRTEPRSVGSAKRPDSRTDMVASLAPVSELTRPADGAAVLVGAITATATITGAALAAASAVGMAATGGLGAMLTHLIDAIADPDDLDPVDPMPDTRPVDPLPDDRREAPVPRADITRSDDDSQSRPRPQPQPRHGDPAASEPAHPASPPAARAAENADDGADPGERTSGGVGPRSLPSLGPRARGDETPTGRPDPGDEGGLALAGDR